MPSQNHRACYLSKLHPHRFLTFQFVWKLRPLFVDGCPMSCCPDFWPQQTHSGCSFAGLWCLVDKVWHGGRLILDDQEQGSKTYSPPEMSLWDENIFFQGRHGKDSRTHKNSKLQTEKQKEEKKRNPDTKIPYLSSVTRQVKNNDCIPCQGCKKTKEPSFFPLNTVVTKSLNPFLP